MQDAHQRVVDTEFLGDLMGGKLRSLNTFYSLKQYFDNENVQC